MYFLQYVSSHWTILNGDTTARRQLTQYELTMIESKLRNFSKLRSVLAIICEESDFSFLAGKP